MKIGSVRIDGAERVITEIDDTTVAVIDRPGTLLELIGSGQAKASAEAAIRDSSAHRPIAGLEWLPPVTRPGKIVCVALNNSANAERIMSGPKTPATFVKPASSLVGHGRPIRLRTEYGRVHPEPELAVVLARGGSDIDLDDAADHVFGYTIMNDLTSPTMRADDTFHYRAIHPRADGGEGIEYVDTWVSYSGRYKGADTFGPMGPWIATADSIADPHDLTVRCEHQGRLVTEDNTANLTHTVTDVIAFVSRFMAWEPGDVLSMGTALKATTGGGAVQNVDLTRLGGPISVSITGIGTLSNPVDVR
jgi:2-keto-4-pentenoate hydratase/2-oxohepta-3-ene-1,7-dioic acid hydratase in catechol pathway